MVEPDPTPPPSKKVKLSEEDGPVLEEADPRNFGDHILLDKMTEDTVLDDDSGSNVDMTIAPNHNFLMRDVLISLFCVELLMIY